MDNLCIPCGHALLCCGTSRTGWPVRNLRSESLLDYLDETEQWITYSAWLRKRHSRLSTLKEELAVCKEKHA